MMLSRREGSAPYGSALNGDWRPRFTLNGHDTAVRVIFFS